MDIYLIQNASSFIEDVKAAFETAGEYAISVDPYGSIIDDWTSRGIDRYISEHVEEFDHIITFAEKWDLDINEYDISDDEKKFEFCAWYIAYQISVEKEYELQEAI